MNRRLITACVVAISITTTLYVDPALAGLDVGFGAAVQIGDDTEVYLAVNSRYYDRDEQDIRRWHRQCGNPDDLAVALFIARHGGASADEVLILRGQGLAWWEIAVRIGVEPEVWFVPVARDPGPPYGNAYGRWKKHGKHNAAKIALRDDEIRHLVAVRLLHEYYGVSVEVAMEWRASGRDLEQITAGEYRNRHGKGAPGPAKVAVQDDPKPGKNKGNEKGAGKGKGH